MAVPHMRRNVFVFILLLVLIWNLPGSDAFIAMSKFPSLQRNDKRCSHLLLPMTFSPSSQILRFRDPQTNVTVVLIGAMHYNPKSIALAYDTIQQLGENNSLGSVVLEQCDIRWNKTNEILETKPYLRNVVSQVLNNEMRTACRIALEYKVPVILGDQRINLTSIALKETLSNTIKDLIFPIIGWTRYYNTMKNLLEDVVPLGDCMGNDGTTTPYLNLYSILDARLWITAPVSFVKYPMSFLVRNPLTTSLVFSVLVAFDSVTGDIFIQNNQITDIASVVGSVTFSDWIITFMIFVLEILIFGRLLIEPLLAERNIILARNILEQCKLYSNNKVKATHKKQQTNNFSFKPLRFFHDQSNQEVVPYQVPQFETLYAPEMIQLGVSKSPAVATKSSDKTVVAVLGMAHCNGIMKLLKEQRI